MENISIIKSSLQSLEENCKSLEIPETERNSLLSFVNNYSNNFLETLPNQKACFGSGYERAEADNGFEITGGPENLKDLIQLIQSRVDATGLNPASAGYLGYIPAGGIYASALGDYMAAVSNRYAGVFYASPGAVRMENALIRWAAKLIGYSGNSGGNLTSGGSYANMIAIAAARSAFQIRSRDIETCVIYICQQAHHSILKALKLIGLDECVIRSIDVDENYRMNLNQLRHQLDKDKIAGLRPFILFANAGSTDVGAVDPLEEMGAIARHYKLWLHVDAAYGGFFLLTKEGREKLKGIELADSVVLDPHKGLFIPYGSGMVIVKDVQHLYNANNREANYMQDTVGQDYEYSPSQLSPELSKHFRGLRMWLPLKLHGLQPFADCLDEKLLLARYFYLKVRELGFQAGPEPDLSIVIFRFEPKAGDANEFNKKILKQIHEDGRVFISSTQINGQFLLRFAILSFRTHLKQVDEFLHLLSGLTRQAETTN